MRMKFGGERFTHEMVEAAKVMVVEAGSVSPTPREFDVLKGVIAGRLNKQIASQLGTTEGTIKVHRRRVMEKMGATSVAELVILAQRAGIAPASPDATKV
jgi:DNA-binding NarL/FixJ family response regulator